MITIQKILKQKEIVKGMLVVLSVVCFTYAIVVFEKAGQDYIKFLIPDFVLCGATVLMCYLNSMDMHVIYAVIGIHHIGIATQCILGTDMVKYFISDAVGLVFAVVMVIMTEYIRVKRITHAKAIRLLCIAVDIIIIITLIIFGRNIGGTTAWVNIFGISLQLTEFLKITYLFFVAVSISSNKDPGKLFLSLSIYTVSNLLVLAALNELGTAIIILIVFLCLVWFYCSKKQFIITLVTACIIIGIIAIVDFFVCRYIQTSSTPIPLVSSLYESVFSKINTRFLLWLNPSSLDADATYQTFRAREAMTQGGLLGSKDKNPVSVPIESSDFIFTAIVENLGIATGIFIVCLFIYILVRMLRSTGNITDSFGSAGICVAALFIVITSLIMILGSTGAFFLTGVPISFLSEGGTQTLINYSLVGIALILPTKNRWSRIIVKRILDRRKFKKGLKKLTAVHERSGNSEKT